MKLVRSSHGFYFFALILNISLISACSSSGSSSDNDSDAETNEVALSDSTVEDPIAVGSDPMDQTRTQVYFYITVPAYQSDALQLGLNWGETEANAAWIGDELWSLSLDLPSDTEHLLTITFSDNNGEIVLATYEKAYRTGFNEAETFQVTEDQFNSNRWDTDNDGTSNMDELINGSDPLVNEDSLLEIRDDAGVNLGFIENNFESRIPEERPYNEYYEEQLTYHEGGRPPSGASHIIEISVDENGNGRLSDSRLEGVGIWPIRTSYTGTRIHLENFIQWEAQLQKIEDFADLWVTTNSVATITIIDTQKRRYEETYQNTYDSSDEDMSITTREIDLMGQLIDGISLCQPVSGVVVSETTRPLDGNAPAFRETIKKESGDQYWRVKSTSTGNDPSETEYFAREFNSTFECDFVEF